MSRPEQTELERLRYWQGQMLRSRDFRDQTNIERQMRYWHNRALHNAFGVRFGLNCEGVFQPPRSTNLVAVRVACGLAYDCFGRELILPNTRRIKIPAAPAVMTRPQIPEHRNSLILAGRYKRTTAACCSTTDELAAVCRPAECNGKPDELEFFWTRLDCAAVIEGVPLAQVTYSADGKPQLDNQAVEPRDRFVAPRARAMSRPHVAGGMTIPGNTPWELWRVESASSAAPGRTNPDPFGVQTSIDTTAAGFTRTPAYFAWLEGWDLRPGDPRFIPFPSVTQPSITEFTFRLLMPLLPRETLQAVLSDPRGVSKKIAANTAVLQLDKEGILAPGDEVEVFTAANQSVNAMVESVGRPPNTALIVSEQTLRRLKGPVTVVSYFNQGVGSTFLSFAQQKNLYVCWVGCQSEDRIDLTCPERSGIQTLCD